METRQNKLDEMTQASPPRSCNGSRCATGGCGGPGLCPGTAFLLAFLAGNGIAQLTGLNWVGWLLGVPLALALLTGAWRFFPGCSTSS